MAEAEPFLAGELYLITELLESVFYNWFEYDFSKVGGYYLVLFVLNYKSK